MAILIKRSIRFFSFLLLLAVGLVSPSTGFGYENAFRLSDGKVIPFEKMIEEIKGSDIVFVGEVHNSLQHHRAQLQIIKSLNELPVPTAIGLEMIRAESQKELDQWLAGNMTLKEFVDLYHANWGIPWPWYKNIFLYAKTNDIPMIGLNLPGAITEKVSRGGFSSLTDQELKHLPPGIGCDIDSQYMDYIRKAYEAHDRAKDSESFRHFCEAQMVWDKTMTWHLLSFLKRNPGKTVVVLTGTGHSWKRGMPDQVRKQSTYRYRVILPEIPGHIDKNVTTNEDADYILLD